MSRDDRFGSLGRLMGKQIVVPNTQLNNVSIVDVSVALSGRPAEIARIPLTRPDGAPSRPKVVAITADGRYATVTGGDFTVTTSATDPTGMVYVIDLVKRNVVAQVTGVGIEPYGVTIVEDTHQ
jgi:hypothetical protein